MLASYYFLDADGRTVRGPFGLQDAWALMDRGTVGPATLICREGSEDWQALDTYPELRALPSAAVRPVEPLPAVPTIPPPVVPLPTRTTSHASQPGDVSPTLAAWAIGGTIACFVALYFMATAQRRQVAAPSAAVMTTPVPTVAPTPAGDPVHGTEIAQQLLHSFPKLNVRVLSGTTFQIHDGIGVHGASVGRPFAEFLLPQEAWDSLGTGGQRDLEAYMEAMVIQIRSTPERYVILDQDAPVYKQALGYTRHIRSGAWMIQSTMSYPDDPDGNLYSKAKLARGPDAP